VAPDSRERRPGPPAGDETADTAISPLSGAGDLADLDDEDDEDDDAADGDDDSATQAAAPAARRKSQSLSAAVAVATAGSVHAQNTLRMPVRAAGAASTEDTSVRSGTTAATPIEALHLEEVHRTRIFVKICLLLVVGTLGCSVLVGGHWLAKLLMQGGAGFAGVVMLWLLWRLRDPANYDIREVTAVAFVLMFAAYLGIHFFGIYSPAPALIVLGIYFFSLGGSRRATATIYVSCVVIQAGLVIAEAFGILPDLGMIRGSNLTLAEKFLTQGLVQVLFLCAFLIARSSRKATLDAIERLEAAVRAVAQREALLLEAKQDLDRALHIGGPGRYSDQQVGDYRLGVLIGRGGMGEVYEAQHVGSGEPAAVKLLHPHALANPGHVNRFLREAEATLKLVAANVVAVKQVGRTEGEVPYFAMERLRGHDLAYYLRKRRRLPPARVVQLVRQVGLGLEAAAAEGIVHRDIKPQNLFLAETGNGEPVWKVLDFGVSKLADHGGTLTKGHVVGTPGYMAPEQARGLEVDHRADIYALAAIAYRALTGLPPFSGKDVPTTLYDVVYKMPRRPTEIVVDLPADVDAALAIGLAKRPDDRFASCDKLGDALDAALRGELPPPLRDRAERLLDVLPWAESR